MSDRTSPRRIASLAERLDVGSRYGAALQNKRNTYLRWMMATGPDYEPAMVAYCEACDAVEAAADDLASLKFR
jgi:hypothetical protein